MMRFTSLAALGLLVALGGCKRQDMYTQRYSKTWDRNGFFDNDSSMRHPVEGTVAREMPDASVPAPATIDAAMLQRGHERFDIFCTPCHGRAGTGAGMIVQRGFPHPPSLVEGKLRQAKATRFYDAITHGHGAMYSYAARVAPADRWAIVAYIRALQLSQNAEAGSLPQADQARLGARQ